MKRAEALELIGITISALELKNWQDEEFLKTLRDLRTYVLENLK